MLHPAAIDAGLLIRVLAAQRHSTPGLVGRGACLRRKFSYSVQENSVPTHTPKASERETELDDSQGRATHYHHSQTAAYGSGRGLLSPRGGSYRQSVSSFVEHLSPLWCLAEISPT